MKKLFIFGLALIMLESALLPLVVTHEASALSGSQFKAGEIMDDALFYQSDSMTTNEIQTFFNSKVPACDTNGTQNIYDSTHGDTVTRKVYSQRRGISTPFTCLKDYKMNTPAVNAESGICGYLPAYTNRTAAQIVHDVSAACGISPKVLIVLLQKEQALVTDDWPWPVQYRSATGYGCPDTAACDSQYYGFFNQVYRAAWQFKLYQANPTNYNYVAGQNNTILYSPTASCGSSSVYIQNQTTAALYNYTPYRPNTAALNNLYGTGDSCSSYGNRNFWRYYNDWFGSTLASVLFKISGDATYYLDWGGFYYPIPSAAILGDYGLQGIAPRTLANFPAGESRGSVLTNVAKFGSETTSDPDYTATIYLVEGGKKHAAPNWTTLGAYGASSYTVFPASLGWMVTNGDSLRPLARRPDGAIFLMENGKKRGFPDQQTLNTLNGPNYAGTTQLYSQQAITNVSEPYLDSMESGAPMLLDGKTIASSNSAAIYLYDGGKKYLFTPSSYAAWGGHADYSFSSESLDQITDGGNAPILVTSSVSTKYLVDQGNKEPFTSNAQTAWGLSDQQFVAVTDNALSRLTAKPLSNLIAGSGPGVYYVENGQKHGIGSLTDFSKLGFNWSAVNYVDDSILSLVPNGASLYAPGSLLRKPNGAVYLVDSRYSALGVTSGSLFSQFGFEWKDVQGIANTSLDGYATSDLQSLLKDSSTGKYYEIDGGVSHYIDTTTFGPSQYNMSSWPIDNVDSAVIHTIKAGPALTQFIRSDTSPTVFYVENGQRHGISSEAKMINLGGSWGKVVAVSDDLLDTLPRGSAI